MTLVEPAVATLLDQKLTLHLYEGVQPDTPDDDLPWNRRLLSSIELNGLADGVFAGTDLGADNSGTVGFARIWLDGTPVMDLPACELNFNTNIILTGAQVSISLKLPAMLLKAIRAEQQAAPLAPDQIRQILERADAELGPDLPTPLPGKRKPRTPPGGGGPGRVNPGLRSVVCSVLVGRVVARVFGRQLVGRLGCRHGPAGVQVGAGLAGGRHV